MRVTGTSALRTAVRAVAAVTALGAGLLVVPAHASQGRAPWHVSIKADATGSVGKKVHLTGNKRADSKFYWHTGYPGGIKERSAGAILDGKHPERVIIKAVERMVPRGPLGRRQMSNLRIYAGAEHPHEAQSPEKLNVAAMNPKNTQYKNSTPKTPTSKIEAA